MKTSDVTVWFKIKACILMPFVVSSFLTLLGALILLHGKETAFRKLERILNHD